jgi:hypothetical protein
VNALPDAPPTAAKNPKHDAGRLLAEFLCYSDRALWRMVYEFCGLRDPNLPDEEW